MTVAVVATVVSVAASCHRARLPPKPDGAAVVVTEPAAEPGVVTGDEVEPNDLLADAQKLDFTRSRALSVAGHLVSAPGSRAKDVDIFRVAIPEPPVVTAAPDGAVPVPRQRLAIEVQPEPGLSVSIDALDDQGKVLVAAIGAVAGDPEGVPNLSVLPGTVFVRVKPGAASAAGGATSATAVMGTGTAGRPAPAPQPRAGAGYRLRLELLPVDAGDESEPNGKGTLANDVAPEGDIAGYLGWRHDEDWFRFSLTGLPEGSVLSLDLDPVDGVVASVGIYDSVEHRMTEQRGRKGDRVAIRNVRLPSSEATMFVVVKAESGRNLTERYTLHLRNGEAKADTELEPNDDPGHAMPLGDGVYGGYLGAGDVDVYRYTSTAPVELDFEATPPARVNLKLDVLRDDGTLVMSLDAGKRHEAEHLPNLYVSGSVLLRLSAAKGEGEPDEPYKIVTSSKPVEAGAEHEPNGTPALATPLPAGLSGSGLVYPRGDVDFWLTQTQPGPTGTLAISLRSAAAGPLEARVQTVSGKDIGRFRTSADGSAPFIVKPGTEPCCLIQIRDAKGRASSPRDRYALNVTP